MLFYPLKNQSINFIPLPLHLKATRLVNFFQGFSKCLGGCSKLIDSLLTHSRKSLLEYKQYTIQSKVKQVVCMITHHLSQILSQPRGHEMPIAGVQSARRRGTVRSVHHCGEYPWKQVNERRITLKSTFYNRWRLSWNNEEKLGPSRNSINVPRGVVNFLFLSPPHTAPISSVRAAPQHWLSAE